VRKLIVSEFVRLDGVMEAPGGGEAHPYQGRVIDYQSPEQGQYKLEEVLAAETLLIGRVTYEVFAASWPERTGELAGQMTRPRPRRRTAADGLPRDRRRRVARFPRHPAEDARGDASTASSSRLAPGSTPITVPSAGYPGRGVLRGREEVTIFQVSLTRQMRRNEP
jgi:hypothetical protein